VFAKLNEKVTFQAGTRGPTKPTSLAPVRGLVPPYGLSRHTCRFLGRSTGYDSCTCTSRDPPAAAGDRAPISAKTGIRFL